MPSAETVKQMVMGFVLPPLVGAATTWLVGSAHVLNIFHVSEAQLVGQLTLLGTWGVSTVIAFLVKDKVFSGDWLPSAVKHARNLEVAKAGISQVLVEQAGKEQQATTSWSTDKPTGQDRPKKR